MVDPLSGDPRAISIGSAVVWLQSAMLGQLATAIAVTAIAAVGLALMSGRLDLRRGIVTVIGCFVVFGASGIAAGIVAAATSASMSTAGLDGSGRTPRPPIPVVRPPADYDPYAGAAMPAQ
ncbi:TrbC/VirB2 family protein [Blastomonas sp. SL216]|uniref:TrbC/VirB2 family protein n=1 Tax=Blastomonas sp. SL216 TaxID=2995169 RepID=UPI0023775FBF|nr:TrbC/VirB2 family protein [Blastomonas sp. SL216]